jgi:hypothetical protein
MGAADGKEYRVSAACLLVLPTHKLAATPNEFIYSINSPNPLSSLSNLGQLDQRYPLL